MMSESQSAFMFKHGTLVGRVLMGALFLVAGIQKLQGGADGVAGMIASAGLPLPMLLAWLTIFIEIVAGAMLILGYRVRKAAGALIIFTLVATVSFHLDMQDVNLLKNLAIVGGLMYVLAYGPGQGWRVGGRNN